MRRSALGRSFVVLALVLASTATASAGAKRKPKAEAPPPGPPPSATLTVATISASRWTLRVENTGSVPLRVVADPRLLTLDVTPPAPATPPKRGARGPKILHCALPADMRPTSDTARVVVVPPGKAYKDSFDPRAYCFSSAEAASLVSGASVVARYGFSTKAHDAYAVTPVPAAPGEPVTPPAFAPAPELVASALVLTDAAVAVPPQTSSQIGGDPDVRLTLHAAPRIEALGRDVSNVTLTLENEGTHATAVMLRPENIGFDVTAPGGSGGVSTRCSAAGVEPIREFVSTLPPKGRASTSLLPGNVCPGHTFDLPGLYEVRPRLDARASSDAAIGVRLFSGEVVGPPFLLRVHRGRGEAPLPTPRVE